MRAKIALALMMAPNFSEKASSSKDPPVPPEKKKDDNKKRGHFKD